VLGHQTDPELLHLRQQHHPQHRLTVVGQGQMHGVFARALQEILGAIEGIEDPQPLGIEGFTGGELLLGGFLAEEGPARIGEGLHQPVEEPLVHSQIRRTHGPFAPLIHAQRFGEAVGGLLAAAIGQEDVGRTPAEAPQLRQQLLLIDALGHAGGGGHHGAGKGAL